MKNPRDHESRAYSSRGLAWTVYACVHWTLPNEPQNYISLITFSHVT